MLLTKTLAFIKRDYRIESSYTLSFMMMIIDSLLLLFLFYFISKIVNASEASLEKYGGNYFTFALVGLAFYEYFETALSTFSDLIQRDQTTGCLEAMLSSQTSPQSCVLMSSVYSMLFATIQLIIIFSGGFLFFNFQLSHINILATLAVFIFALLTFISFGLLSASLIIVVKKGDPFSWFFVNSSIILGGAFFPVEIMPPWLQMISKFLPTTYALDAIRLTILQNHTISMVFNQILILGLISVVLFPVSIKLLLVSIEKAKKDGTLVHY